MNKIILIGRPTNNPEIIAVKNGYVANFTIAYNRKYKLQNGNLQEEVSYFDCVAYGKTAERIGEYCVKGTKVIIEGRLRQERWESKEGEKRSKIRIVVEKITIVAQPQTNPKPASVENEVTVEDIYTEEEEFPF